MPQEVVNLVIGVKGATEATQSLQTLDKLVSQLNNKKITLNVDTGSIQTFSKEVEKSVQLATQNINAQARLLKQKNQEISLNLQNQKELTKQAQLQAKVALEAQKTQQAIEKTAQAQANAQAQAQKTAQEQAKVAQQAEKTAQAEAKLATEAQKTATVEERRRLLAEQMSATYEKAALSAQGISSADSAGTEKVQAKANAVDDLANGYQRAAQNADMLSQIEKKVGKSTGETYSGELSTNGFQSYIRSLEGMQNATVAATRTVKVGDSTFQQFDVSVRKATGDYDNFTYSVDTGTKSMYKAENGMSAINKTAGKLSQSLGTMISKFAQWYIVGTLVSAPVRALSDALTELKKVDAELVNIQKVMGATSDEMERLSGKAFEVGSSLGIAASDYLASVTKWAQAGYGSLSDELGELSVKTQKVGDVQEETANQFLLSVDAAYKYKGNIQELTKVLDGANEISNNYATSVEKLAGGMGIVSSLAAQAGMKVEETMAAIGTITAVTQESGNSAARALRALILNIQGSTEIAIDEETGERWTEDEIQQMAAALGDLNIATREYKDGVEQLRNPMEVIGELSQKYRDGLVSEVQLQEVVSALGGKVRSNQLQALISNFDTYTDMLETYRNAAGSADKELEVYLNSWEAKANRFRSQWAQLLDSLAVNDITMRLLDMGNALMEIVNTPAGNIVALATAIGLLNASYKAFSATTSGAAFIEQLKGLPTFLNSIKSMITGVTASIIGGGGLKAALAATGTGIKNVGVALKSLLGIPGLIIAASAAIYTIVDALVITAEEQKEIAKEAAEEFQNLQTEIDSTNQELKDTKDRIDELQNKGSLTLTEQRELDLLKQQNQVLEARIALQRTEREETEKNLVNQVKKSVNTGYSKMDMSLAPPGYEEQIQKVIEKLNDLKEKRDEIANSGELLSEEDYKKIEEYDTGIANLTTALSDIQGELVEYYDSLSAATSEEASELRDYIANLITLSSMGDPIGAAISKIDSALNGMDATTLERFNTALESLRTDGKVTESEIQELADQFPFLNEVVEDGLVTWEQLAEAFSATEETADGVSYALDAAEQAAEAAAKEAEELSKKFNDAVSSMKEIEDAQKELNETGALSVDTVISLIEKYPELNNVLTGYLAGIEDEISLQAALSDAYDKSANDYKSTILQKMGSSEDFYKSVVLGNEQTVAKLKALGIEDLENYKTIEDLKKSAHSEAENEQTKKTAEETKKRILLYQQQLKAMANSIAAVGGTDTGAGDGVVSTVLGGVINAAQSGLDKQLQEAQNAIDSIGPSLEEINKILYSSISIPNISGSSGSGGSSSSGSSSTQSWYETQISALQELVNSVKDTNTLLEKEDKNSAEKRIQNLMETQATISKMADAFRAKGLSNSSDEVKQLKLMWHDLADEIEAAYQSMYDALMDEQGDKEWSINLFEKNADRADKSVEEISADNEKIVASYKEMQEEVAQLAAYYRSKGYDETDDLIQDLSDAWWDYQDKIESVYDRLSEAFEDYISESDRQIKELERTTGTAGQQIELYTQRIQEAQKAIAELQKTNVNGLNDDRIGSIQDQIYSDEDSIADLQQGLWDELADAIAKEFERRQGEIDHAQNKLDEFNQKVADLDEELQEIVEPLQKEIEEWKDDLEDALDDPALSFFNESLRGAGMSITEAIKRYTEAIEKEQDALEKATDPLRKQIEGYYIVKPDGTIGGYVPGLEDKRDDWQELLDKENERWEKEQEQHDEDQALAKKQLALTEAIKNLEQAQLDLETAKNERTVYTLKDGVWAWRADESAIKDAEEALEDAEQAKDDAQDELDWLKLEQAHNKLANFYKEQVKLEQDKIDELNKQIEALERESEARQDYLNDQLDLWEDEKEAWEEHYNNLIENNEKEIEAWEEYYEKRKEQYDDDIKFWEDEVKRLQEQYDAWADEWDDIQASLTEDARSFEEILADIAKYGTPAMKEQIDNVTDLLEKMGIALDDFNSSLGGSSSGGSTGNTAQDIINQMKENAQAWHEAQQKGDTAEADRLDAINQNLAAQLGPGIGAWRDGQGVWRDKNGNPLFELDFSGGTSSGSSSNNPIRQPNPGATTDKNVTTDSISMRDVDLKIKELRDKASGATTAEKKSLFQEANALAVSKGALSQSYTPNVDDWMWYNSAGDWLFDQGGVARGRGVMVKDVEAPEVVLSPVLAADVLNPIRNQEFMQFADALGIMFSTAHDFAPDLRATPATVSTNNTDSHNIYINGVQIGESMVQRPLSETLSLLGIHRNM